MSDPIVKKDGSPFPNLSSAKRVFTKMKLNAEQFVIEEVELDEGNVGYQIVDAPEKIPEPVVVDSKGRIKMGEYPIIQISPPAKGEPKKIDLGHNGITFTIQRGVNLCLPRRIVGVLDIAVERIYPEVTEGEDALPIDRPRFPYTFIRNGTKADFDNMVKTGASI